MDKIQSKVPNSTLFAIEDDSNIKIGKKCYLGENVSIYKNVSIGNGCVIESNVILRENVKIQNGSMVGQHVYINAGSIIEPHATVLADLNRDYTIIGSYKSTPCIPRGTNTFSILYDEYRCEVEISIINSLTFNAVAGYRKSFDVLKQDFADSYSIFLTLRDELLNMYKNSFIHYRIIEKLLEDLSPQ